MVAAAAVPEQPPLLLRAARAVRAVRAVPPRSMDVDLTAQLLARRKSPGEASSSKPAAPGPRRRPAPRAGANPPTRLEQKGWERSGKYARKVGGWFLFSNFFFALRRPAARQPPALGYVGGAALG